VSLELSASNSPRGDRRILVIRPVSFAVSALIGRLAELRDYWDLIWTLSVHRIKVRYKQSILGLSWAVLQPLTMMALYTFLFSYVMKVPSGKIPYPVSVFGGILPWLCFQTSFTTATNGLVSQGSLITKVYFPREILLITCVIASMFDFAVGSTVLIGMMIYYHVPIAGAIVFVIPIMLTLAIFVTSLSLISSMLQVRFRDIGVGIPLLLQLWMFATPVVYPLTAIASLPAWIRTLYMLNPMVGIIDGFRQAVLFESSPDPTSFGISVLVSILLFPVGYTYFKYADANAVDSI
jgi:lipopolysaccharide transport system permease protein